MSIFYKARRVGKDGEPFTMYKFKTLKDGSDTSAFHKDAYLFGGRFLRKYRIDELPQIWNIIRGDMALVGPRPQEERTINLYPSGIKEKLLSVKPGWFSPAGIHFMHEGQILEFSKNPHEDYWIKIQPMKLTLDFFYVENKGFFLDLWVIYQAIKKGLFQ